MCPLGFIACDPSVSGVREVDGAELAVSQQKTVQRRVAIGIGTYNPQGVEDHGWKCSQCTREIDESELSLVEQVPAPVEKIRTDEPTPTTSPALLMPKPVVFTLPGGKSIVMNVPFLKT